MTAELEPPPPERILRRTPDRRRAEAFALGLDAAAIDSRIERAEGEWRVVVAEADAASAQGALEGFDEEVNALAVVALPTPAEPPSVLGMALALGLSAFYLVTGPVEPDSHWFKAGAALSGPMREGAVYRSITALTLHAHFAHLLGNAAFILILGSALGRTLGGGVAGLLILATGIAGNEATAFLSGPTHASIGASTAVFGALGLVTAQTAFRRDARWRTWIPIGASLALLGMLGSDRQADVLAHLFGWSAGLLLGSAVAALRLRRASEPVQLIAGTLALAAVGASWWHALTIPNA